MASQGTGKWWKEGKLEYFSDIFLKQIRNEDVKVIAVPQYDELTLDEILDFGLSYKVVEDALPIIREIRKMPREYICNVIYTLVGEDFKEWMM